MFSHNIKGDALKMAGSVLFFRVATRVQQFLCLCDIVKLPLYLSESTVSRPHLPITRLNLLAVEIGSYLIELVQMSKL